MKLRIDDEHRYLAHDAEGNIYVKVESPVVGAQWLHIDLRNPLPGLPDTEECPNCGEEIYPIQRYGPYCIYCHPALD